MKVSRSALALEDIWEIASWLAEREDAALALRFVDAVETSIHELADQPKLGPLVQLKNPQLARMRFWRVKGFPNHLIFYQEFDGDLVIVRVLHGARELDSLL